ncbi:MAG: fibronectin type III domain-containing protein, partial [candidate division Zixibacteria bacterium]|nr:fibronectin type III domain-containing protein [candidate division Zixibacteria bacterium]
VIYRSTGSTVVSLDSLRFWDRIDSNLYYAASGTNLWVTPSSTNNTFAQWQARSVDSRSSSTSNPNFDNPDARNFARSTASNEMNRTYGGRTWTVYGAVQVAVSGPRIGVNPSSLTFAADEGAANPADQSVLISNTGIGTLDWSVSSGAAWLNVSPTIGSGNASISVSADITGLAASSYSTNLTISATGADNSPLQLPVSLSVTAVDNTAPIISGVTGVGLASSTASNVYWTTNEPATSQVEYGLSQAYGTFSSLDATLVTDHAVTLTGLTADTVYHYRVISRDALNNEAISSDYTFRTLQPSSNLALGRPVTVSASYSGYLPSRVTDGTIAPSGGTSGTWASDQSTSPHWVEIDLQQNAVVRSLRIYWANNTATSQWMRSQSYVIQTWNGTAFVDLATVDNRDTTTYPDTVTTYDSTGAPTGFSVTVAGPSQNVEMSATDFPSVTTSRIRIYQPSNMGPESYSTIMWITEVEVYSEDVAPPQTL